ncbi:hypothetical protein J11TS1_01200 [Oceanobacillus sp. J11TS1]|nr:hypothetical protein J11TS1_01200 [Oceanobacillus sp. J11TS1]
MVWDADFLSKDDGYKSCVQDGYDEQQIQTTYGHTDALSDEQWSVHYDAAG